MGKSHDNVMAHMITNGFRGLPKLICLSLDCFCVVHACLIKVTLQGWTYIAGYAPSRFSLSYSAVPVILNHSPGLRSPEKTLTGPCFTSKSIYCTAP
eukprot:1151434-Pelagomonas_calceolata.AAC.2